MLMSTAPDPSVALKAFQQDLDKIPLTPCETDPKLLYHLDQPGGMARLTFVRLQERTVTAMAVLFAADPVDGVLLFHGFYAVPEAYRDQGRAKDILRAALRQIERGFARADVTTIRIEVVVDADNAAGQEVAAAVVAPDPVAITDQVTGRPALRYSATLRRTTH
jgi:RimJ/RimL family protein N-acetyltransferase